MESHGTLTPFDAAAVLIVLAAALGYLNHRLFHLPQSVALTIMGAVASLIVVGIDSVIPGNDLAATVVQFLANVDFRATLMDGLLSFLLFAGALHIDWSEMRRGRWPVLILSTLGVIFSTALVGFGFHYASAWLGLGVPLVWCLVFGAVVSPTDPVAVMEIMKRAHVAPTLRATVAGESLFNDGIGIVVFSILIGSALGGDTFSAPLALKLFLTEAGGGVVLGLCLGWIAFRAMKSIDEYNLEVLISLAVVMGGYSLGRWLHVSGPVAMAVAGLIIGNHGVAHAMSETTRDHLLKFWTLIDSIMNAVLFLLIGLEIVTIPRDARLIALGSVAILIALASRALSVMPPLAAMRPFLNLGPLAPTTFIWGGLRGGISIALALSLPDGPYRAAMLAATYFIVLFAVVVQGGTIERVLAWRTKRT